MAHSTRWIRGTLWALAALLLAWALAWLAVPPLAKWQLQQQLGEKLGRGVTVGKVGFEPWALRLTIEDLAIAGAAGSADPTPQFSMARVQLDLDARSLLRLAPVVESLQIDAPRLRLARIGEGRYDIDDVAGRLRPDEGEAPGEPARFALHNLTLTDGAFTFEDRPAQRRHTVSGFTLALPFVSNLPSFVDVKVEPRLAFTLDGARYESSAEALPFGPGRSGALKLHVAGLDIAPYRSYLPDTLPVRVERGRVDADLAFAFAAPQDGAASLAVSGQVGVADLALAERAGTPLLELSRLSLGLKDVQPLARKVALGTLRLDGLQVHLDRDARGVLGLRRLLAADTGAAAAPAATSAATLAAAPAAPAWQASLDALEIAGARVLWNDAAVQPASAWVLDGIDASAQQLRWPASAPMPFSLQAKLRPQSDASATLAALTLQGQATDVAATARIGISALSVAAVAPYANAAQRVRVAGTGTAEGALEWAARDDANPMRLVLRLDELAIDGLRLGEPQSARATVRGDTLAAQRVQLSQVALDLAAQSVVVGSARLRRPVVRLERTADGAWNVMRLAGPTALSESDRPLVRAAAEAIWQVRLDDLAIEGGRIDLVDALPAPGHADSPVRLGVEALALGVRDLRLRGERLISTPQVSMSARVVDQAPGRAREQPGRVEWRGRFGLEPMLLAGKAKVERLPVDAVQAYFAHPLGLRLERAEAGFQGEVTLRQDAAAASPKLDLAGDVLLSDLRVVAVDRTGKMVPDATDRELLNWQSLALKGLAVAVRPGVLPKVVVREASLSDFFARLVLTQEGELNLNTVRPRRAPPAVEGGASAPTPAPAPAPVAAAVSAPPAATTAPFAGTRLPLELELGGLRLVNGRVDFSDRFVQPNYSAALTDLNGDVGAFRSGLGEAATLRLSGRVAGTGLLEIEGNVKPGTVPRELDVHAKASDVELAPLSTYSGKYAGYAIERGKLSVEVRYKIDPAGKLDASHQVVLNQLTFGERVESPSATKLPVRLAVALLKDRHGVIDINLPVGGSLEDPQFSVGPIIWQVIGNLIAKAATAPFALLAGGGGPDLSVVEFVPGTAGLAESAAPVIDKVAKALGDRPSLKMTVVGEADIDAEAEAYRRASLEQRLQQELRREQLRASGAAPAAGSLPTVAALSAEDRVRLVKVVYRETDLPDKPRNLIGLKADIPPAEMEALLQVNVKASPEAMRELALQRGLAVRDALIAKGLPGERLFVGAPKVHAVGSGATDKAWTPQVKLSLDTR